MSNKNYEDPEERRIAALRRLGILMLVLLGIVLIFLLLKGCGNKKVNNDTAPSNTSRTEPIINNSTHTPVDSTPKDLNALLLESGKEYYEKNSYLLPKSSGECGSVDLLTLTQEGLIDRTYFTSCKNDTTYLKVCKLSSGKYQFVGFLDCTDNKTENKYSDWQEGTESNIIANSTDVRFLYQADYLETKGSSLGNLEEVWEDEIKYQNYKTEGTTKYYRYRDLQYIWSIKSFRFYPSDVGESSKVSEYYISSPASGYTNKTNKNDSVAKYFSTTEEKIYWLNANGSKKFAEEAPDDVYKYKDNPVSMTLYRSRSWTETSKPVTSAPVKIWYCGNSNNQLQKILYEDCATQTKYPNYTITIKTIYTCETGPVPIDVGENGVCYRCTDGNTLKATKDSCGNYGDWSEESDTPCDTTKSDLCENRTITTYNWYKLVNGERKYYPSGASKAKNEKTYYAKSPSTGLIRDEETVTTGWKWYKEVETQTSGYSTTAPQDGAVKTNKSKWTEYSSWSTKIPDSLGSSGTREIQSKLKIKLRPIISSVSEEWKTFNEDYLSLDELLKKLQDKGYKVYSIEDINKSGELKYKVKLMIRNIEVR